MNYTKGEWKAYRSDKDRPWLVRLKNQYGLESTIVEIVVVGKTEQEQKANAHLIAAAPRMAKLLEYIVNNGWNASVSEEAREILNTIPSSDAVVKDFKALNKAGGK